MAPSDLYAFPDNEEDVEAPPGFIRVRISQDNTCIGGAHPEAFWLFVNPRMCVAKVLRRLLLDKGVGMPDIRRITARKQDAAFEDRINLNRSFNYNEIGEGDVVRLLREAPDAPDYHPKYCCICGWCILVSVSFVVVVVLSTYFLQPADGPPSPWPYPFPDGSYGVVVDAGSVHTTVNLYEWPRNRTNGTGIVREVKSCEIKPLKGLSQFESDPGDVEQYFQADCPREIVTGSIPAPAIASARIFVGGTAGMRDLNGSNPGAAAEILAGSTAGFTSYSGVTKDFVSSGILDSNYEGLYGWITTNHLSGVFSHLYNETAEEKEPLGALDWGGASSEISFPVEGEEEREGVHNLTLFGESFTVFTASHMCYGQAEALRRYFVRLIYKAYKANGGKIEEVLKSPCQPKGSNEHFQQNAKELFFSQCTVYKDQDFQKAVESQPERNFTFIGQSDDKECQEEVRNSFDVQDCKSTYAHPYCFDASKLPRHKPSTRFLAFSTYWYLLSAMRVPFRVGDAQFGQAVTKLCTGPRGYVAGLLGKYGPEVEHNSCFKALFMRHLLNEGYGFGSDWDNVEFVKRVNDAEVGWAMGYMLNATSSFGEEDLVGGGERPRRITTGFICVLIVISMIYAFACVFYLREKCCGKKAERLLPNNA